VLQKKPGPQESGPEHERLPAAGRAHECVARSHRSSDASPMKQSVSDAHGSPMDGDEKEQVPGMAPSCTHCRGRAAGDTTGKTQ
jgi:hypothetical protein